MKIHKEGYASIIVSVIVVAVINALAFYYVTPFYPLIGGLILAVTLGLFSFFLFSAFPNVLMPKAKI